MARPFRAIHGNEPRGSQLRDIIPGSNSERQGRLFVPARDANDGNRRKAAGGGTVEKFRGGATTLALPSPDR